MKPLDEPGRVLVIEDSPVNQELARQILEEAGYAVMIAEDGRTALEIFENHRIDVVTLDLVLPDRDGLDVARAIREMPGGESLPVIAVSAHEDSLDEARLSSVDFAEYLAKPINTDALQQLVGSLITHPAALKTGEGRRRRILVVDDDPIQRRLTSVGLERNDFVVETAVDGQAALELALRSTPDAIVSDALMPRMDGFDLCRRIRADPTLRGIPFVIVSSHYVEAPDLALGRRVGANACVVRSPSPDGVVSALLDAFDQPTAPEATPEDRSGVDADHAARVARQLERQVRLGEALRARCRFQQTLLSIGAVVSEELAGANRAPEILRRALDLVHGAPRVQSAIGLLLDEHGSFEPVAALGLTGEKEIRKWILEYEALLNQTLDTGRTSIVSLHSTSGHQLLEYLEAASAIVLPLRSAQGDRFGVVVLALSTTYVESEAISFLRMLKQTLVHAIMLSAAEERFQHAQRVELVGRLTGGVAHDFNNLLTVIGGLTELAAESLPAGDRRRQGLEQVLACVDRGASLTGQLLDFSRKRASVPSRFSVNALVKDLVKVLRHLTGEEVDLHTDLSGEVGEIFADPRQIEHALINLVVNARDAMPQGGRLEIATAHSATAPGTASTPGAFAVLSVSDSGVGMSPATKAQAFDHYFTTKPAGRGTGLGLATVAEVVRQAGGHVDIQSEVGQGTTVSLYLPVAAPQPDLAPATPIAASDAARPSATGSILVLEHEHAVRTLTERMLRDQGFRVASAGHAKAALALAERLEEPVELLVTDVSFGNMSGPEITTRIRERWPDMRVLYVSGYADSELEEARHRDARSAFLSKPFSADELIQSVDELLARPAS